MLPNAGATIAKLASGKQRKVVPLRQQIEQIQKDILAFKKKHKL